MTPETDRDLDALLAETKALRQRLRTESAGETPPPHVDAAILAAARRAVNARPTLVGRSPWRRWQVPLAAAAVLVVATSLTLMIERHGEPGLPLEAERPADSAAAVQSAETGKPEPDRNEVVTRRADVEAHRDALSKKLSAKVEAEVSAGKAIAGGSKDATGGAQVALRPEASAVPSAVPPASAPVEAEVQEAKREQENHAVASSTPPPAAAMEESRPARQDMARAREAPGVGAPAAAAKPDTLQAPVPTPAPAAAAPAQPVQIQKHRKLSSEEALRFSDQAPESTLLAIRKLWEAGHERLARERLAEFLREHPGYPLPSDFPVPRPAAEPFKERPPEGR